MARALSRDKEELRLYILMARDVLQAVAQFCHRRLEEVGVRGNPGKAGYYFMPDFSVIRSELRRAGIVTGQEMCDDMLARAGVALMPSEAFLLSPEDLSVRSVKCQQSELKEMFRFCYVIFDGEACMAELRGRSDRRVDEVFVRTFCPDIVRGVERLCQWVTYWRSQ